MTVSVVAGPRFASEFERRLGDALARHTATVQAPLEVRCSACDGVGAVLDPEWAEWHAREWDARVVFERAHPDEPPWLGSDELARLRAEQRALPRDEELPCLECSGSGAVPTEAGRVLLGFLRRHLTL